MKKILFVSTLDSKLEESKYIINKLNLNANKLIIFDWHKKNHSIKSNINRKNLLITQVLKKLKIKRTIKILNIFLLVRKK